MSITVSIEVKRDFKVKADFDQVFDLLANVPESASHFPKVDKLVDLGDNTFRWEMEKLGVDKHALQTVYACKYISDKAKGSIVWTPITGEGNGVVSGSWTIEKLDKGTHIKFHTEGQLTLPLPGLLKLAISPVVKHEFNALVDTYTDNLKDVFNA
ncbi:MAG: SRPBCC family protein [Hahellaceae bacterium]|nr:SRPBCC family protein [Hahellaceae bacterium]MCP5168816.1 SRPBCC family protein [Hahellaceae bacterium]